MTDFADQLIAEIKGSDCWPLDREAGYRQKLIRRRALRKGEKSVLRSMAGWTDSGRNYLVMPLPKLIARTFADFLFGEAPEYTTADDSDQDLLDEVIEGNSFTADVRRAARTVSSEGEAWWAIHTNPMIADVPLIEWHSRLSVVPLFYGNRVLAAALVSEIANEETQDANEGTKIQTVWRRLEVHTKGRVVNKLFCGGTDYIGTEMPLESRTETAGMADEWKHGLDILVGRVINDVDEDVCLGESDYDQVEDLLLSLNESLTISSENARLTGKDRIFAAGRLTQDGVFDAGVEVFTTESEGGTLGEDGSKPPVVAIEKKYDSEALWHHLGKLKAEALSSVGIVMQLVGEQTETGAAEAGVAIRLRYLPTINASEGKAAEFDAALPVVLDRLLRVASLPTGTEQTPGGFGWGYTGTELPTVARAAALPADETEIVTTNATAVTSEIRSRFTAVKAQHPDWSDTEIEDELRRIEEDMAIAPVLPIEPPHDPADPALPIAA